jgi:hypothetical protein
VSENKLQKKLPDAVKEKTQYVLAFGVIAAMLFVAGFPMFVITFFGIFAYFLWKTFTQPSTAGVREVFEFYLAANEILRDDDRRWFGFEVQEVVARGELILQRMNGAPPLVYFTLGALYNKIGNHKAAVNHLTYVLENEFSDETQYNYATPELKNYVKILRKIEREPSEAPQTSAAIRALERARRTRGKALLEQSRAAVAEMEKEEQVKAQERKELKNGGIFGADAQTEQKQTAQEPEKPLVAETQEHPFHFLDMSDHPIDTRQSEEKENSQREEENKDVFANRKPISEVLRDIYDK